jgi:DNA end-binding protein Ku
MAARPSWDGYLKFNLISVPVKAYNATVTGGGKIGLHLVHAKCHNRIRYQKVCPIHGEVTKDEIVSAYEIAKGQYVVLEPGELAELKTENDKAISIDTFIHPDALDPIYFSGSTYYLVPDGRVAQKPYAAIQEVLADKKLHGIAQVVFAGRGQVAAVRAMGGLLAMSLLSYTEQVRKPAQFEEEVTQGEVSAEERRLAQTLIEASTSEAFDLSRYHDEYTARLAKLIEAHSKGKKIVAEKAHEEPVVINLMDALRQSLDRTRKAQEGKKAHRAAGPHSKTGRAGTRRKTG